ncbi:MAG: SLC13 family permease [Candidatus Palauibacterales bacterium]|nr:SLC13 family permease [Candidatus Palauibacterales bacterium]MDP2584677.1 SLC13 family permease [Candidatus Palauibacterales bacterium]
MSLDAAITLAVVALTIVALAREVLSPDVLLFGALVVLVAAGVLDFEAALRGFSNPVLLTIAGLLVVAAGLKVTGALEVVTDLVLGTARTLRQALARLTGTTVVASAFLNNTAIVAMGIPVATRWSRRRGIAPSRVLIPLSYASILGGLCTLIGTSTNLVVDGLMKGHGLAELGFFELARIGVPIAVVGLVYLVLAGPALLPDRSQVEADAESARRYLAEMRLTSPSPLIGRTVEDAGLRHLPGLFLVRIERTTGIVAPVGPAERLAEGDRLTFAGLVETIVDLRRYRGLEPITGGEPEGGADGGEEALELHEAVISPGSPLVGSSIREASFRARYNAAVIAVHRHGERIERRIGDIVLRPGDALMLEAAAGFDRAFRDSSDFYLVSRVDDSAAPRHEHRWISILVLATVVTLAATGLVSITLAAALGGLAMVATGCLSPGEAKRAVDWSLLVVIGSALGIAVAMEKSGAAALLAEGVTDASASFGPRGVLAGLFLGTLVLTELITNNAAAALMFPVAVSVAGDLGLAARPLVIAVTVAASLSMATPLGYQTNLMVYGPGGYRFTDFTKAGLPLQLLAGAMAVVLIPVLWPMAR